MITPTGSQLISSIAQKSGKSPQSVASVSTDHPSKSPREPENLAASIKADGGLGFLQASLEKKLDGMYEKASAVKPENSAAEFFNTDLDVTPEATADRIVSFALGLKNHFQRQNPQLDEKELLNRFEAEIRRGISDGFSSARGALGNLELLEGQISENVDTTWDLVQAKLDEVFQPPQ